jgi:hypothetical protein
MMKYSEITEEELKVKGVEYVKDEKTQSYYIEKDSFQKLQDYTIRVLGTPFTVVLDTGLVVVYGMAAVVVNLDKAKK